MLFDSIEAMKAASPDGATFTAEQERFFKER